MVFSIFKTSGEESFLIFNVQLRRKRVRLPGGGCQGFDEIEYLCQLENVIHDHRTLVFHNNNAAIGGLSFFRHTDSIKFIGVHR